MRILVTGANGPAGQALGEQLRGSTHVVIGADMDSSPSEHYDLIEAVPAANDPAMLQRLAELIRLHRIDVMIPTVSDELPAVAGAVDAELSGCTVMVGDAVAVATAHDKWLTMQALRAAGVSVPVSALPSRFANAAEAFAALGSPLILKPRVARGGRGVQLLHSADDIEWDQLDDTWLLQEFASGEEYAPMVFNSAEPQEPGLAVVVRKTELKQGLVGNAVDTVRLADHEAPDIAGLALDAVRALGLGYQADLDVRRLADGRAVVLEINARFGANSRRAPELLTRVLNAAASRASVLAGRN